MISGVENNWPSKVGAWGGNADRTASGSKCMGVTEHGIRSILQEVYWSWSIKCEVTSMVTWACPKQLSCCTCTSTTVDTEPHLTLGNTCQSLSTGRPLLPNGDFSEQRQTLLLLCTRHGPDWDFLRTEVLPTQSSFWFVLLSQVFDLHCNQKALAASFCWLSPSLTFTGNYSLHI